MSTSRLAQFQDSQDHEASHLVTQQVGTSFRSLQSWHPGALDTATPTSEPVPALAPSDPSRPSLDQALPLALRVQPLVPPGPTARQPKTWPHSTAGQHQPQDNPGPAATCVGNWLCSPVGQHQPWDNPGGIIKNKILRNKLT